MAIKKSKLENNKLEAIEIAKRTQGLVTRSDLCAKYKVTPTTFNNYEKQGMPCEYVDTTTSRNVRYYDPVKVEEWYNNHFNTSESSDEADLRKKRAEATLSEIKVMKARGELISSDAVIAFISAELATVRSKLIALSGIIAPHIYIDDLSTRVKIVDDAVQDILSEITSDQLTAKDWSNHANTDTD